MKHLGDIKRISGYTAVPVNVVIGGSPCQDLSIAGNRAGLAGERSGLFMEQIRVIKEMRCADAERGRTGPDIRPRWMVWENVPGAFSSNKGADFGAVLHETVKVACPQAPTIPVPDPKHGGGWPTSGCYYDVGGRWSVAWRVFDAQFWGVPQRRRRIALVADFGGLTAPEILFERKGVSGDSQPGGAPWKAFTTTAERCVAETGCGGAVALRMRSGCDGGGKGALIQYEKSGTLRCHNDQTIICLSDQGSTLLTQEHRQQPIVVQALFENHTQIGRHTGPLEVAPTVAQKFGMGGNNTPLVVGFKYHQGAGARGLGEEEGISPALCADGGHPPAVANLNNVVREGTLVRRLTPLECERLQGFPDGWTDIGPWTDSKGKIHKESSDAARYRALGNSIALPSWVWVLARLSLCAATEPTMASLFDGIGGFPLIWEWLNGKGTCLWASEIEEFPIAVTKQHFSEEDITDENYSPQF